MIRSLLPTRRRLFDSGTMMAPLPAGRKVLRAPPPLLTAVRFSDSGFYSMVLCWAGPPERSIAVRLPASAANLREAQAEAADQLLSFDSTTLAWLYEHAQPTARVPDRASAAERPVERESSPPSSKPGRLADSPQSRRSPAQAISSARPIDRRPTHRIESGEARRP